MEADFITLPAAPQSPQPPQPQRKRPRSRCSPGPGKELLKRTQHAERVAVLGEEDASVKLLEELVFGETREERLDPEAVLRLDDSSEAEDDEVETRAEQEEVVPIKQPAWIDPDDITEEQVDVTHRFRKDFVKGGEKSLSKSGLQQRMRDRYEYHLTHRETHTEGRTQRDAHRGTHTEGRTQRDAHRETHTERLTQRDAHRETQFD
uniref:Uncharacterized protein n=1 Tax=Knipowitschia caucasica TaxID=637954 RepID=A0AAV2KLL2_KNICA